MPYLKTFLFMLVVPGTVLVLIPYILVAQYGQVLTFEPGAIRFVGIGVTVLGAITALTCAFDFAHTGKGTPAPIDPPKTLIVRGLYRYTRNPMYVGVLLTLFGEVLIFGQGTLLIYFLLVWTLFHCFTKFYEERKLTSLFGEDYITYCQNVPRWFPRWGSRS